MQLTLVQCCDAQNNMTLYLVQPPLKGLLMTSPIDAQILWQQWLNQQAEWSQVIQQQTTPVLKTTLERIQAASTLYQIVAQKILPDTSATAPNPETVEQWLSAIQDTMSQWSQRQPLAGMADNTTQTFQAQVQQWEQVQQAIQDYQQVAIRYHQQLKQLNQQTFTTFKSSVLAKPNDITSLQGLIEQWGRAYEQGYSTWTSSEEYQALYAELVNAGVNVRAVLQNHLQPLLQWLNVPSQKELQLITERYHELRRAHQELREQFEHLAVQVAGLK